MPFQQICKAQGDVCFQTFVYMSPYYMTVWLSWKGVGWHVWNLLKVTHLFLYVIAFRDSPNLLILPLPYTDCTFAVQVCTTQASAAAVEHEHQRQVSPCSPLF